MTVRDRILALINAFADEPLLIRKIATWCIIANAYDTIMEREEAEDAICLDAIRAEWPEAGEDEISLGHNLALAVVEVINTQPIRGN